MGSSFCGLLPKFGVSTRRIASDLSRAPVGWRIGGNVGMSVSGSIASTQCPLSCMSACNLRALGLRMRTHRSSSTSMLDLI